MRKGKNLFVAPFPIFIPDEMHQLIIYASTMFLEEPTPRAESLTYIYIYIYIYIVSFEEKKRS